MGAVEDATSRGGPATVELVPARRRGRVREPGAAAGKDELVDYIARELDTSKADSAMIVDAVARGIAELAHRHEMVRVPHLGNFRVLDTAPREGRNPRTGESVPIGSGRRITFRAAKSLKVALGRRRTGRA